MTAPRALRLGSAPGDGGRAGGDTGPRATDADQPGVGTAPSVFPAHLCRQQAGDNRCGMIVLITAFCFIGPLLYHTDQVDPNLLSTNLGPRSSYLLGTDNNGFDILGRLMLGGQSSIEVGFAVAAIATVVGILYGAISGFFGKAVDVVMMRVVDVAFSIPLVFLFIFASRIFQPTLGLLIVLLGLVSWLVPARLVRGETLALKVREYVQAVRTMGGGSSGSSFATSSPTRWARLL